MNQSDLAARIRALILRTGLKVEALYRSVFGAVNKDSKVSSITFRRVLGDTNVETASLAKIEKAIGQYCAAQSITEEQLAVVPPPAPLTGARKRKKTSALAPNLDGHWLMVQYRSTRSEPEQKFPAADIRFAVLRYGEPSGDELAFSIYGSRGGLWNGTVRELDADKHFYVASERNSKEWLAIIMLRVMEKKKVPDHYGIVLGIGAGEHDLTKHPAYASQVYLRKIPEELASKCQLEPDQPDDDKLLHIRGYFSESHIQALINGKSAVGEFIKECVDVFESGKAEKWPPRMGERMYVYL